MTLAPSTPDAYLGVSDAPASSVAWVLARRCREIFAIAAPWAAC
eukprot:CAMPEP_0117596330 /NCGR_PEP_ID=MMETSP0784-20121206/74249_1 /TAXON_ID=39447 /ORGANISM="" /LENGTH=43 /DNA_ID= /DNA_START= /DNA_END= /DNA_ORIENTATION=